MVTQTAMSESATSGDSISGSQVTVSSVPDGATIFVNGSSSDRLTPYTFRGLARGLYMFRVKRDGYIARPESVSVSLVRDYQSELLAFELAPDVSLPKPTLTILTTPLAAGFRLDGKPAGVGKASVQTDFGSHRVEFAEVPGYQTPAAVSLTVSSDQLADTAIGEYVRLVGNSYVAISPSEDISSFDGSLLRVYVDNELIIDRPKQKFEAALVGKILSGKRLLRVQYGDLTNDLRLNLIDGEVSEITLRVESFFAKRSLRLRERSATPLDQWQQKTRKLNVLTIT
jgi:hypothetical protein